MRIAVAECMCGQVQIQSSLRRNIAPVLPDPKFPLSHE